MSTNNDARPTQPVTPVLLSVTGAVCGALAAAALHPSPNLRLVGVAIGAAIPPLIGVAGALWGLRASAGVLITAGVLVVTYGGGLTVGAATGDPAKIFPKPDEVITDVAQAARRAVPEPRPSPTVVPSPTTVPSPGETTSPEPTSEGGATPMEISPTDVPTDGESPALTG